MYLYRHMNCLKSIKQKCITVEISSRTADSSLSLDHMEIMPHTKYSTLWIPSTTVTYLIKAGFLPLG